MSHHDQKIVTLTLSDGRKIVATAGHPFHTPSGWRVAQLLQAGGQLDVKNSAEELDQVAIKAISVSRQVIAVYNLSISNARTFFIGQDGVLVHNVHGNSRESPLEQFLYEIYDKTTGLTRKYGVTSCKTRYTRPRTQLRPNEAWREMGHIPAGPGARGRAYDKEQSLVDSFAQSNGGAGPKGYIRPQPSR